MSNNTDMINAYLNKRKDIRPIGFVYLITDGVYHKIGMTSKKIEYRIKGMQTGNANKLILVAYSKTKNKDAIEWYLHKTFHKSRHRGEWFKFRNERQIKQVVNILNKAETKPKFLRIVEHQYFEHKAVKLSSPRMSSVS